MLHKPVYDNSVNNSQQMLVTIRVALHYLRPDNYHVFRSRDVVVELGLLDGT